MTQEQKDLLLKDLCARLPYKLNAQIPDEYGGHTSVIESIDIDGFVVDFECVQIEIEYIKPYLFPLSSMTEGQKEEHKDLLDNQYSFDGNGNIFTLQDFYCKYHIDYRGLIPMGLALDATNLNIYEI